MFADLDELRAELEGAPDDEMPTIDSGPFCVHWGEPGYCERLCECGHRCHPYECDGCECDECREGDAS